MAALEDAATALVLERGYDAVTVDEICSRAEIAKRTFFNYVPSKEAAVIGTPPETVPEDVRAGFLSGVDPDVPGALLTVFLDSFAAGRAGDDAHAAVILLRRRSIFRDHPALAAARMTATSRFHQLLVDLTTEHFATRPGLRRLPGVHPDGEARACVALVSAAAGLGVSSWLARDHGTFADLDEDCATALGQLARLVAVHPSTTSTGTAT